MRTASWTDSVSVLDRVTAVLDTFDDDGGLGVSEIARRANLPKSTVSRIVADLVVQGYLDRDGVSLHIGPKLLELGQAVDRPTTLSRLADPIMTRLRGITGASVLVGVLDAPDVVLVASLHGRVPPNTASMVGTRSPAARSAVGRAILAHSPHDLRDTAITAGGGRLREQLLEIQRSGVSTDQGDSVDRVVTVASAICIAGADPLGAIAVAGPGEVIDARRVGGLVRAASVAIARRWSQQRDE